MSVTLEGPDGRGPFGNANPQQQQPQAPQQPAQAPHPAPGSVPPYLAQAPLVAAPPPQAEASRAAAGIRYVTDARGRRLGVKKLGPSARLRFYKAIGAANAKNDQYVGQAILAYMVCEIDGVQMAPPLNEIQLEALSEQIGDDGINAVAKLQIEDMGITDADLEAAGGDPNIAMQIAQRRLQKETIEAGKA
jgi:hypothetical protein